MEVNAGYWVSLEDKWPTNFSLSPELDKLKLVGHQTDPGLNAGRRTNP
jgi:hypothetical protein